MVTPLCAGLSAFPLTPLRDDAVDLDAFVGLITRLVEHRVDSITVLGSTGSYAYLSSSERDRVARTAVEVAAASPEPVPVIVGVGALRTSHVLAHMEQAEAAGAAALLLAPMSYQPLVDDDVFELFRAASDHTDLPIILYDNPGTTRVTFDIELYGRIAELPRIASIKIPAVPDAPDAARQRIDAIRAAIPSHVTIGVSGDASAARGLLAGCDAWYSVIAGTLPGPALTIMRAIQAGDADAALSESARLAPLWELYDEFGSLRVTAAIAELLGYTSRNCLPLPIQGLTEPQRARVATVLEHLELERLELG